MVCDTLPPCGRVFDLEKMQTDCVCGMTGACKNAKSLTCMHDYYMISTHFKLLYLLMVFHQEFPKCKHDMNKHVVVLSVFSCAWCC